MRVLSDADALALWESGATCHPLDRALLLCARARDDLAPTALADLPLGVVNASLVRWRVANFGTLMEARVDCERCREYLEVAVAADALADVAHATDACAEVTVEGFRFRAPTTRDLAAVAGERDADAAALRLLERCCVSRPVDANEPPASLLATVEVRLEELDPAAVFELAVTCGACGHAWTASLDIGEWLWDEIAARAAAILDDVHRLALAYGWSEAEILALSPQRRAAYLNLVGVA